MNISTGGPHILLFERDQQLAALLLSELQLAGYECHTARTAVEVFDAIARYTIRLVLVNLAQAATARREFWVALDTQRRDRKVQVFTFRCTNLAGYGPLDPDDAQGTIADMEIDGMLGLMSLVNAVRTRVPGPNAEATMASTMPRMPKVAPTPQPPPQMPPQPLNTQNLMGTHNNNSFSNSGTSFRTTIATDNTNNQTGARFGSASTIQQASNNAPSMPAQPTTFAQQMQSTAPASTNQPTYTEKIRAVIYPNQRTWNSQASNTFPVTPENRQATETPSNTIFTQVPLSPMPSNMTTLQQLANGQAGNGRSGDTGMTLLSRMAQGYHPSTIDEHNQQQLEPGHLTGPQSTVTQSSQADPSQFSYNRGPGSSYQQPQQPDMTQFSNTSHLGNNYQSPLQQPAQTTTPQFPNIPLGNTYQSPLQQRAPQTATPQFPNTPPGNTYQSPLQQQTATPQFPNTYAGNTYQSPLQQPQQTAMPQFPDTSGLGNSQLQQNNTIQSIRARSAQFNAGMLEQQQVQNNTAGTLNYAPPAPRPAQINENISSQTLRASPIQGIPTERTTSGQTIPDAGRRPDVLSRTNYGPQQTSTASPPLASITATVKITPTHPLQEEEEEEEIEVRKENTPSQAAKDVIENEKERGSRARIEQALEELQLERKTNGDFDASTTSTNAVLLDIVQSLPPISALSQPRDQTIQPQVLNGRATRSLGNVLLDGHLVPQDRLEVAQNIQRMLRGVDLNYQLGEILLMFKLLTPDQLLAASLVSYGLITTAQISALGRIRQELHAIGLEYDLENLLVLFRILTPEQLREVRSSLQS